MIVHVAWLQLCFMSHLWLGSIDRNYCFIAFFQKCNIRIIDKLLKLATSNTTLIIYWQCEIFNCCFIDPVMQCPMLPIIFQCPAMILVTTLPTAHPSLLQFIDVIEQFSREKARVIQDIRKSNCNSPKRKIRPRRIPVSCKKFNPKCVLLCAITVILFCS